MVLQPEIKETEVGSLAQKRTRNDIIRDIGAHESAIARLKEELLELADDENRRLTERITHFGHPRERVSDNPLLRAISATESVFHLSTERAVKIYEDLVPMDTPERHWGVDNGFVQIMCELLKESHKNKSKRNIFARSAFRSVTVIVVCKRPYSEKRIRTVQPISLCKEFAKEMKALVDDPKRILDKIGRYDDARNGLIAHTIYGFRVVQGASAYDPIIDHLMRMHDEMEDCLEELPLE